MSEILDELNGMVGKRVRVLIPGSCELWGTLRGVVMTHYGGEEDQDLHALTLTDEYGGPAIVLWSAVAAVELLPAMKCAAPEIETGEPSYKDW